MPRVLLRSLDFDSPPRDPAALSDEVAARFRASSITGPPLSQSSAATQELWFVEPASLVLVLDARRARFYRDDAVSDDGVDEEHGTPLEPEDPAAKADEIATFLAAFLEGDDEGEPEVAAPEDDWDRVAKLLVEALLASELLELSTPRSRGNVERHVAHTLARGVTDAAELGSEITECQGAAEVYADDETIARLLREARESATAGRE